jgi:DNA-binding XRE family transcriptional regulator
MVKTTGNASFLNNLKQYRKQCGYDRDTVARFIGLKRTKHLARWEKGISVPDLKNLFKLCILYNANPIDLYSCLIDALATELSDTYHNGLLPTIEY